MGEAFESPSVGAPTRWYVVFNREASTRLMSILALGRYKHVRAFGYVVGLKCWVFYDVSWGHTELLVARDSAASYLMASWCRNADVLELPVTSGRRVMFRFGFWCIPAIKHLVGLRCAALRPDALYRYCIRIGARNIHDQHSEPAADCPRSDVWAAADPGQCR